MKRVLRPTLRALACSVLLGILIGPQANAQTKYRVIDLGHLGGGASSATAINRRGQVVGYSSLNATTSHAFLWHNGVLTDLTPGTTDSTQANALNDKGDVVGDIKSAGATSGFVWKVGVLTNLPGSLAVGTVTVTGINNKGEIIGNAYQVVRGHLFSSALAWTPSDAGGYDSNQVDAGNAWVSCINKTQIGGTVQGGIFSVFRWEWLRNKDLSVTPFDAYNYVVKGINSAGQLVGSYDSYADYLPHAFLWTASGYQDLGDLGGGTGVANAINPQQQVVGRSQTALGEDHAFLWQGGAITDLNSLISGRTAWVLTEATGINSSGWIVGYGTIRGQTHAFLLRPQP